MSTIDEPDLIQRVARRAQLKLVVNMAVPIAMVVWLMMHDPLGPRRPPPRAREPVPGRAAGADAGHPPAARRGVLRDVSTWVVVVPAALVLPLSVFWPRHHVTGLRRKILAGTFRPRSRDLPDDPEVPTDRLLNDRALRSDTGKLLSVWEGQFDIRLFLYWGLSVFAAAVQWNTQSPIALAIAVLLPCAMFAQFPTRTRVASWIDGQQEWLIQERQRVATRSSGVRTGKGLQQPGNRPHRDDGSGGIGEEVCGWLADEAAAVDPDHPRKSPDH